MKLLIAFAITFITAFFGSKFTMSAIPTWYQNINKAPFNPPNWVFGPAWTILYTLMAIAFYLILSTKTKSKLLNPAITVFIIQLVLNFLWSYIFFTLHLPLLAFIDIIILWLFILLNIIKFAAINKTASYLLYPYIAWVSFASILNFYVVILN